MVSGECLGFGGILPSKSKVQHLLGANNFLETHFLVKSQRIILIRVGKLLRVRCTDFMGLVEVRVSWPRQPRLKKKNFMSNPSKLKIRATLLLNILSFLIERDWRDQEKSRYGPKRLRWTDGKRSYLGEKLRSVPFQKNMPNGFVGPKQQQE